MAYQVKLGVLGDQPIVRDWDGDGRDEVGVYRGQYSDFYEASYDGGATVGSARFGVNGDLPVIGQW
ncbi:hypothetical protein [Kitasatospora paranensis]|uniref:Uncharacterized protein n=1 Tax=Kitasatospora paranensis TaxID=258053 RepID=A0ABW2G3Q0_9ACTN